MRVKTWVETSQEVDVEISIDDVMATISELDVPQRNAEAIRLLNICLSAVIKVPDHIVDGMTHSQRAVITDCLQKQLARYMTANAEVSGAGTASAGLPG
jgi:hypothetical protein